MKITRESTDKEKFIGLAQLLGDDYEEKPKSLTVPAWKRRFTFNIHGYLNKVQDIVSKDGIDKMVYKTISEVG